MTLRNAPPEGRDGIDIELISVSEKQKYFCGGDFTWQPRRGELICPSGSEHPALPRISA